MTTTATWEVWGNFYGVPASNESIIAKYNGSTNRSFVLVKRTDESAGQLRIVTSSTGSNTRVSQVNGIINDFTQLVVTHDGATWAAYVDGYATEISGAAPYSTLYENNIPVEIGTYDSSNFAALKIGSAKTYNVALTADEVLQNYNAQKSKYGLTVRGEIDLFLASGQSNAVGTSGTPSAVIPDSTKAKLYGDAGVIDNIIDPVFLGLDSGDGSMWPNFAHKYIELTGRNVGLVGYAENGSAQASIADFGPGNWDATGALYDDAVLALNAAIAKFTSLGYTVNIRGLLWAQGEQDAEFIRTGGMVAQVYTDALTAMMVRFRAEYGATFPLHMVRTGVRTGVADTGSQAVRDAQDAYVAGDANSYMATTDTVNFPTWGWLVDTVHYNQTGQDYCGEKVAISAASLI